MTLIERPLERLLALDASGALDGAAELEEAAAALLAERWRGNVEQTALSPRQLDLFYRVKRLIPRSAQLAARRMLIRRQGLPEFPAWPYDDSVAAMARRYARRALDAQSMPELRFRWFWPDGKGFAFCLTHDVESAEGLRCAVELADAEETRGLRSSFNVVADWYPIDWGIVRELAGRGFEIGLHGIHHDRSLFASRDAFELQLPLLREAADQLGAVGFRSPATHRVVAWLPELPVEYDCTIPHSDPFEPQPGGCCSPWPFFLGDLVELPYTMPQDHTVFTLLRERNVDRWLGQVERLAAVHGLVQSVSHPDPGYLGDAWRRDLFVAFLDAMCSRDDAWHALPRDIARWWRRRDGGADGADMGTIRAGTAPDDVVFTAPA